MKTGSYGGSENVGNDACGERLHNEYREIIGVNME